MADVQLKLSRRALLGAACGSAFVPGEAEGRGGVAAAAPRGAGSAGGAWPRALAAWRRAAEAVAALEGDPDEDAFDRALDLYNEALARLLGTPAPDIAALATKLELAVAAELHELSYAPASLAHLAADARRLS